MLAQACFYTSHLISYFSWLLCQSCSISHDGVVPRCASTRWSCGACCVWSSCTILLQTLKKEYILWLDFLSSWNLKSQPVARGKSSMLIVLFFNIQIFTITVSFVVSCVHSHIMPYSGQQPQHALQKVAMLRTICCTVFFQLPPSLITMTLRAEGLTVSAP